MLSGPFKVAAFSGLVLLGNLLMGCDRSEENPPPITTTGMLESLPFDKLVSLQSIAKVDPNTVACVIYPYENGLYKDHPQATIVNDYLTSIGYQGTEAEWSIVWINGDTVSVTRIEEGDLRLLSAGSLGWEAQDDEWTDFTGGMGCSPVSAMYAYRSLYSTSHGSQNIQGLALVRRNDR